jgi:ABC-2 type transport system ATP-binding protein
MNEYGLIITMVELAIEIKNLVKKYGDLIAVNDISLEVKKGEIFAFLGPNGAGKTTTVEIFEGLREPDTSEIRVFGFDVTKRTELDKVKRLIGTLPQEFNTHENLTVLENIRFWGRLYHKAIPAEELITLLKLEDKAKERFKNLSGGLKRSVGIAISLVNDPLLVVLDEPTTGLDPRARRESWQVIEDLQKQGKTIFLTTHYMEEAQVLADRVAIIHKGKIMDVGTPTELIDKYGGDNKIIVRCNTSETRDKIHKILFDYGPMENDDGDIVISGKKGSIVKIIDLLDEQKVKYTDIITQRPTLEDVFLALTGETLQSATFKAKAKEIA